MMEGVETRLDGSTLIVRIPMRSSAAVDASASSRRTAARWRQP
jgi:hypothetical protein